MFDINECILYLIKHDFYSTLSKLDAISFCKELFDLQTILYKRFISFLLNSDLGNFEKDVIEKVSLSLNVYLINFTNYHFLINYQLTYLKRLISNIIKIFDRCDLMIDIWFKYLSNKNNSQSEVFFYENDEILSMLLIKASKFLTSKISNYNYFPLYGIVRSFIFNDDDDTQLMNFNALIGISNKNNFLKQWLLKSSDISFIVNDKFLKLFNEFILNNNISLMLLSNKYTFYDLNKFNHKIIKFIKYLKYYCEFIFYCPDELKIILFENFILLFLNLVFTSKYHDLKFIYILKILGIIASYLYLTDFLILIFKNENFQKFFYDLIIDSNENNEIILVLNNLIFNHEDISKIIFQTESDLKSFNHFFNNDMYCEKKFISNNSIIDLSYKTMNILKNSDSITNSDVIEKFLFYLEKAINSLRSINFVSSSIFGQFFLKTLIEFFINNSKYNISFIQLSESLIIKTNLCFHHKFKIIVEFLYTSYHKYVDLMNYYKLSKFNSANLDKIYNKKYHSPDTQLIKKLDCPLISRSKKNLETIDYTELSENLKNFRIFHLKIFIYCKIKSFSLKQNKKINQKI